jgi:hypothetical protein
MGFEERLGAANGLGQGLGAAKDLEEKLGDANGLEKMCLTGRLTAPFEICGDEGEPDML